MNELEQLGPETRQALEQLLRRLAEYAQWPEDDTLNARRIDELHALLIEYPRGERCR